MADKAHLERLLRAATDAGKLIEIGWLGMRIAILPPTASAVQIDEMRKAYYLGAQHLFSCMISIQSAGDDVTEQDLARMKSIHDELDAFITAYRAAHPGTASKQ